MFFFICYSISKFSILQKGGVIINKIRIILADDHAVLRSGLKALLNNDPQFEVVGEAENGIEAIALVKALAPDVLILDLSMPDMNGMDCIKEIRSRGLTCPILVLSMYDDEEYIKEVMRSGANSYVLKKSADTELMESIIKIHKGKRYLNEKLSQSLLNNLLYTDSDTYDLQHPYKVLSVREREVLRFLALGHTNSEIATTLSLSPKTIDTYRSRIMNKLNIHKKSDLVNYAIQYKLITI
ncbi:response regulator [Pelosinus propionicus]|uniref:DNA-binding response regulator, NarL/FixJ family, contains REC and HTH domains n=1 Tax=Pelosinus propionicus DSM 13327 TaxID=1123291 RepID=A0A1I4GNQ9_9FIRM|nr:response regulator transcription factor [Pelosinus propionicus]SFL31100.1 DNA-binding response regulator, NarL/FixJ family, contains REC and HTH domains [Pelosinus propionicus DSM 13327]